MSLYGVICLTICSVFPRYGAPKEGYAGHWSGVSEEGWLRVR